MKKKNFITPSQVKRIFDCPGSVQEQQKIQVMLPPNPAAVEGTAIHKLAERCLRDNIDPGQLHGQIIDVEYEVDDDVFETFTFTINDDFIYSVRLYRNTILKILQENGLDYRAIQLEAYTDCPEIPLPSGKNFGGTPDCKFIAGSTLHIFDLKGGRGIVVDPFENKQCMSYAIRSVIDARMFIDKVVLWIIQPRAKEGDFIKSWETTPERIESYVSELKCAITKTTDPNAPRNPGEECRFCIAAGSCSALQKGIVETTSSVMPTIHQAFPRVESLTPEQIGNALPALHAVKTYLEILEGYATTLLHQGKVVPNYALVTSRKNRQWRDESSTMNLLSQYLSPDEYMTTPKLRTPAQVEKLVGKDLVKEYIFTPPGDLKVVMEKEAKDYIKRSVEDVFKNVQLD